MAGFYVDTVTVSVVGAAGSPATVVDTLKILALPEPLTLVVQPGARSVVVDAGEISVADSASVILSGAGASITTWTASHGTADWITVTTSGGTGSGAVTWLRDVAVLNPGVYIDTITVTATGANGSPARVIDTITVRDPIVPLTVAVEPVGRRTMAVSGDGVSPLDSARVVLAGAGAASEIWVASSGAAWSTFNRLTGTGTGYMRWTRDAGVLTPGIYVDTITVVAGPATSQFLDTLEVTRAVLTVDDAVQELLEGGVLADVHKRYLDSLGNRDGVFNLGDVLAHLDRLDMAPPPELGAALIRPRGPGGDR